VLDSADLEELGPNGSLSRREREVLEMTALGLTNGQIAGRLGVTVHAVKFHLASIYRKLGVANRTEAAVLYLRGEREDSPAVSEPGRTR
jgi:DNA-binding CsgD family transcriptional regulator